MEEMQKKVGRRMSIMMGLTLSCVLSLVGMLMSGHFTLPGWLLSFGLSALISVTIGFIVPMKKLSDAIISKLKLTSGTIIARIITTLVSTCIYTPLIVFAMISLACTQANGQIDASIDKLQVELSQTQEQLQGMTNPADIAPLKGKEAGLTNSINDLKSQKPVFVQMYLRSLGTSMILSFILSFFIQPIYLKMIFKHYGIVD